MHTFTRSLIAAVALFTAACGAQNKPAAPASEATPAAAPAAQSAGLTPAALVGRWGDNGDCSKDIVFGADGTFQSYTGGGGTWTLNGDVVSMTGANGTFEVGVELLDQNTLMIRNGDGSFGTSQRC